MAPHQSSPCSLRECLVEPEYLKFINVTTEQPFHVWLVLREFPGNGYGIVYEECSASFGFAQFADGYEPCFIGLYGDFFYDVGGYVNGQLTRRSSRQRDAVLD